MLMAVFEGRAPERRPQSPTEVAARPLEQQTSFVSSRLVSVGFKVMFPS